METTEPSTKMEVETNGNSENKDVEPGELTNLTTTTNTNTNTSITTTNSTTTEAAAETKDETSVMPVASSVPTKEETESTEVTAAAAAVTTSIKNDSPTSAGVTNTSSTSTAIADTTVEMDTTTDSVVATTTFPPKAASIAGGTIPSTTSTATGEKIPSEKPEGTTGTPTKTATSTATATDSGATATAPVVSTSTSTSTPAVKPTTVKPKPSPTGTTTAAATATAAGPSKVKIIPVPNSTKLTVKSSATKITVKNTSGATKTATSSSTKSLKKGARKKRKTGGLEEAEEKGGVVPKKKKPKRKKEKEDAEKLSSKAEKSKKVRKQAKKASSNSSNSGSHPYADHLHALPGLSAAQMAVQEQMRKALEEDQYSANGSVVDTDSDDDEHQYMYKGQSIRLDRAYLLQASKKIGWLHDGSGNGMLVIAPGKVPDLSKDGGVNYQQEVGDEEGILNEDGSTNNAGSSIKKKSSRDKKKRRNQYTNRSSISSNNTSCFRIDDKPSNKGFIEVGKPKNATFIGASEKGEAMERDEGSIFGQTTGSSNSTWVECDKCKKWRRLRGVVDHSKLPKKWYCSMNRNDPERARCSAPEEEYDAPHTPESAADARTRKHLRVWVRRLQCNEQYESRLPTLTRGKKRSVASSSKEPHEWIRCCNPSCGKWRAILRIMDAKQNVIDRTSDGEWYCVMNTWDEKTASCAAPQENLPAVGCPPWVLQDEN